MKVVHFNLIEVFSPFQNDTIDLPLIWQNPDKQNVGCRATWRRQFTRIVGRCEASISPKAPLDSNMAPNTKSSFRIHTIWATTSAKSNWIGRTKWMCWNLVHCVCSGATIISTWSPSSLKRCRCHQESTYSHPHTWNFRFQLCYFTFDFTESEIQKFRTDSAHRNVNTLISRIVAHRSSTTTVKRDWTNLHTPYRRHLKEMNLDLRNWSWCCKTKCNQRPSSTFKSMISATKKTKQDISLRLFR